MPVTNITPATATEVLLSTLPFVDTQTVLDGTVKTVYFKVTNDLVHDAVITLWFYGVIGANPAVSYVADFEGFSDITVSTQIWDSFPNCAIEVPIPVGDSWWIKVSPEGAGAATPTLNMNVSLKPYSESFPASQIVIFAASVTEQYFIDNGGLHAGFINPLLLTPTARIVNFIPFFPASEQGDLVNNVYLISDSSQVTQPPAPGSDLYCLLYSSSFDLITRVQIANPSVGNMFEPTVRSNIIKNKFWLGSPGFGGAPQRYATVTQAGVISAWTDLTVFPSGLALIACCVGNNDDTFLMVVRRSDTSNFIYRWNLATLAWDATTLGTEVTNYTASDILALADGTFVVSYFRTADKKDTIIRRYNSIGTQLNTMSIATVDALTVSPRLGYARDTAYFWLWMPKRNGVSLLKKVKASDFSLLIDTTIPNVYETQIETATPSLIYVSDSCPVIETPGAPSLFIITTDKRTDHDGNADVKIPNPTFKTALMP